MESNGTINTSTCSKATIMKHILITSHGGVLRQVLMRLIHVDKLKKMGAVYDPKRKNRLITPNASLSILDLWVGEQESAKGESGEERTRFSQNDKKVRNINR